MDPMTRAEALDWGPRELGCGVVAIELTEAQIEDAFDDALRWWIGRRGVKRHAITTITQGVQEYAMPDDTDEVIDFWFPGVQLDVIAAIEPYAFIDVDMLPVAYQSLTGVPGGQFYGTLHQIIAHAETARRVISSEPAWSFHKATNVLHIFPKQHMGGVGIVRYASTKLITEDPTPPDTTPVNDFRRMHFRDRELILRYFLAKLKEKLGRIRSKYSEWPSAGGSKTLDGTDLVQEAREELADLRDEIMGLSDGVPFIVG